MADQIVVLGFDALDGELIEAFDLAGRFGMYQTRIDTLSNPVIGKPHTMEVWPSLITGRDRDGHGIVAVGEQETLDWENPIIDHAAPIARSLLPQSTVSWLGARLRERGATLDAYGPDYYARTGLETVFDRVGGRPISIPNYMTAYDERYGLDSNRDRVWRELDVDRSPENAVRPTTPLPQVADVLGREVGQRVGHTIQAMQAGEPLVWTWFGVLDTVGHLNPAVDAPLQREWYRVAAGVVDAIKACADPETAVVCLSDHGLQDGQHTAYATLCSDTPTATETIDSVLDVADWLEARAPAGRTADSDGAAELGEVHDHLADLGYV